MGAEVLDDDEMWRKSSPHRDLRPVEVDLGEVKDRPVAPRNVRLCGAVDEGGAR